MKFEDFDLDLTKIAKGYGVNPMQEGCDELIGSGGGGFTGESVNPGNSSSCVRCESDHCPTDSKNRGSSRRHMFFAPIYCHPVWIYAVAIRSILPSSLTDNE